jgi:medium-chain acyl-[acyl-carrier-protein] hydrolase
MIEHSKSSLWLLTPKPKPNALTRLFIFPHAGGSPASFWSWPEYLADNIEIVLFQFPGRGARLNESAIVELPILVHEVVNVLESYLDKDFVFFGHSLGSLIAFETTRALRKRGILPLSLFVSSGVAPQLPNPNKEIYLLPDEEFIKKIKSFNGVPEQVFEYPELVEILFTTLRMDFTMLGNYKYLPEWPIECPITAYGGTLDPLVKDMNLMAWQDLTAASFSLKFFNGGHFYFNEDERMFFNIMGNDLASLHTSKIF